MQSHTLTADRLRECLAYDSETGIFTWNIEVGGRGASNGNGKYKIGSKAGGLDGDGYVAIRVDGGLYRAHRLAWLYVKGEWPSLDIDHKDGERSNNKFSNLTEKSRALNSQNRITSRSKTGLIGAHFDKQSGKFAAEIRLNGKRKHLGKFETAIDAHKAYIAAKILMHPGFEVFRTSFAPSPIGAAS